MTRKRSARQTADALSDLRRGWDGWIAFATERPKLFRLMVESTRNDPGPHQEAYLVMRGIVQRLHEQKRLLTDVDTAARTIWAASNGILTLFMQNTPLKDIQRSSDLLFSSLADCLIKKS